MAECGGEQAKCQLDLEDFGEVQCLWRFQGNNSATKLTEQKLNSLEVCLCIEEMKLQSVG